MELIPVNGEALKRAMEAVSGPEVATLTLKAYAAIDQAMHYGFLRGEAGYNTKTAADLKTALDHAASAYNEGFSEGVNAGRNEGAAEHQESYDNGYMDGVEDARVDPEEADDYIAYLCSLDVIDDFDDEYPAEFSSGTEGVY